MAFFAPALLWLLPQVVLPRPQDLQAAARDEVELRRLGLRLGPARLLAIAAQGAEPGQQIAALTALGLCGAEDGVLAGQALRPLSELLLRASDEPLLAAGAAAARRLGQRLGRDLIEGEEGPGSDLPRAAQALLERAAERALPPELRAELIEAATALPRPSWRPTWLLPLVRASAAAERPVQQAALAALYAAGEEGELQRLTEDEDAPLAAAAAAALCEGPRPPGPELSARIKALAATEGAAGAELRRRLQPCLRRPPAARPPGRVRRER